MTEQPRLDDLLDGEIPAAERDRLERVHALLVGAGPAPAPTRSLLPPAEPRPARASRPRRRVAFAGALAALILVSVGAGYVVRGDGGGGRTVDEVLPMRGPGGAEARLVVFARDPAGNWAMSLSVSGLAPLPDGRGYELWLTKGGRLADPCGTFIVVEGENRGIWLNAPYELDLYDGWVIVAQGSDVPLLSTA
jgi:Anti-sigma-K factor rskA